MNSDSTESSDAMRAMGASMLRDIVSLLGDRPGIVQWARRIAEDIDEPVENFPVNTDFEIVHPDWRAGDYMEAENNQLAAVKELAAKWSSLDSGLVAEKIARIEREARAVNLTWPNWTPQLCEEIAQQVASPLGWAKALHREDAPGHSLTPFLRRAAALSEDGWSQLAMMCLDTPGLKSDIIGLVLTLDRPPSDLLDKTLNMMDGSGRLANFHCHQNQVSDLIASQLLRHENEEIATSAALGLWLAEPYGKIPETLRDEWQLAIRNANSDDTWLSEILKADSALSFEWLQRRLSENPLTLLRIDKSVDAAVGALSIDGRRKILQQLPVDSTSSELVNNIIGDDLDLYRELLSNEILSPLHLLPLIGRPQGVWIEKAKLALDAGYGPEEISNTACHVSKIWWGNESAMWDEESEPFNQLLSHDDDRIQKIGELCIAYFEASRENALIRERREAVYGIRRA